MSIVAQDIITDARNLLQDVTPVRWTDAELLAALNAGQLETVNLKPEANAVHGTLPMIAGILQTLPTDGVQLIKVVRNATSGAVRLVEMDALTEFNPDWPSDPSSATARNYMYDRADPTHFYVYPQQPAISPGSLNIVYAQVPAPVADLTHAISLPDIYKNALIYFVCFRALAKETDLSGSAAKSAAFYQAFQQCLGLRTQADTAETPKRDS